MNTTLNKIETVKDSNVKLTKEEITERDRFTIINNLLDEVEKSQLDQEIRKKLEENFDQMNLISREFNSDFRIFESKLLINDEHLRSQIDNDEYYKFLLSRNLEEFEKILDLLNCHYNSYIKHLKRERI